MLKQDIYLDKRTNKESELTMNPNFLKGKKVVATEGYVLRGSRWLRC